MSEAIYWKDPNSNPLDRAWVAWYNFVQDDRLASGIAISFIYNLAFFGTSIFFIAISRLPVFEKYKIQKSSVCVLEPPRWFCVIRRRLRIL
jgi:hypothetical protein